MKHPELTVMLSALLLGVVVTGNAAESAPESPWGVAAHPMRSKGQEMERELSMTVAAGIRHLRTDFGFKKTDLDADPGFKARLEYCERFLERAEAHGLTILPILQGFDWEILEKYRPLHKHLDEWRTYVRAFGEHFKGRITVWQVWNEPDGGFWKPHPDAKQYVPMLKIAYEELKRIDPANRIVLGGLCGWNADYLADMYGAGAKGSFDIAAVHPYGWGPDASAKQAAAMARFKKRMADRGEADKDIWFTECGGSTFRSSLLAKQSDVIVKAMEYALKRIGAKPPATWRVGVPLSVERGATEPDEPAIKWLPGVELVGMTPETLAKADPKDLPVMIGTSHLAVERVYLEPMRDYVARGGVLLAFGAVPFYAERFKQDNGTWIQKDNAGRLHPFFRIGFEAHWTKKGLPASTFNVRTVPELLAEGIKPLSNIYVTRYLSDKNLKDGDTYTPMVDVVDKDGSAFGQTMALYTFGDWKGAILGCTMLLASGFGEGEQANLLQRVYLSYLAEGVKRMYVYDLRNDGENAAEKEDNFGLLRRDFQPKPSYRAYEAMIKALGANPRLVERMAGAPETWILRFRRAEDGKDVIACWAANESTTYTVPGKGEFKGVKVNFLENVDAP